MQYIRESIQIIIRDRPLLTSAIVLWLLCLAYTITALIGISTSDHQIVTHYSIFGESHFYRSRWWYLLSFIAAGLFAAVIHTMLATKLLQQAGRSLAIAVLYAGCVVLVITGVMMLRVYGIAVLS